MLSKTIVLVCLCWIYAIKIADAGILSCPRRRLPYTRFGLKCFAFVPNAISWHEALDYCKARAADLVKISNQEDNDHVKSLIPKTRTAWIGLHDEAAETIYRWRDGTVPIYRNWAPGEPNHYKGREYCVELRGSDGSWNDVTCSTDITAFVCESPADADCGDPEHPGHTNLRVNSTKKSGIASYSCTRGFQGKEGDVRRKCLQNATWSGTPLICQKMKCSSPEAIQNTIQSGEHTYGSTVVYTCLRGYYRSAGGHHVICNNGSWEGNKPTCSRLSCGDPGDVSGATKSGGYHFGDVVRYICNEGYQLTSGNQSLQCQADQKWRGVKPSCNDIVIFPTDNDAQKTEEKPGDTDYQTTSVHHIKWFIIIGSATVIIVILIVIFGIIYITKRRNNSHRDPYRLPSYGELDFNQTRNEAPSGTCTGTTCSASHPPAYENRFYAVHKDLVHNEPSYSVVHYDTAPSHNQKVLTE